MRPAEQGFLLLSSHLGDPQRKVLTTAQLRTLAKRARELPYGERDLAQEDLLALGYDREMARRILELLEGQAQLAWYLSRGRRSGCVPVTRVSEGYPQRLRSRMGLDAPGCLWAKGDLSLLTKPAIALVGSRELKEENRRFAMEAGRQAARQGFVLVSGNAKGADREAQDACLDAGGQVISVVADELAHKPAAAEILWLSEDGFDLGFSAIRALSRNRVIHSLPEVTLVAQCTLEKGGTWDGTLKNLHHGYSPVLCCNDGSAGITELIRRGVVPIGPEELEDLRALPKKQQNLFNDQPFSCK